MPPTFTFTGSGTTQDEERERLSVLYEMARYSIGKYDDLSSMPDEKQAAVFNEWPDLVRAVEALRQAKRLVEFELKDIEGRL